MVFKKNIIVILSIFLIGCNKKSAREEFIKQNLVCEKILLLKTNNSKTIIFKIEVLNNSDYEMFFQSYPNEMISSPVFNQEKKGFVMVKNSDNSKVKLFSTDESFINIPSNGKSHFYLKLNLNELNYSEDLKSDLKNYSLRYFGKISFYKESDTVKKHFETNVITIPFENPKIKQVNYENLIFEKDLDTIKW